jgi:hypothetical protein
VEEGGFELVPRKTPGVLAGVGSRSRRLILVGGKSGRGDKRRSLDPVVSRGTDSSNPVPSSGESAANLTSSPWRCQDSLIGEIRL